jgi:hypothetical protein
VIGLERGVGRSVRQADLLATIVDDVTRLGVARENTSNVTNVVHEACNQQMRMILGSGPHQEPTPVRETLALCAMQQQLT